VAQILQRIRRAVRKPERLHCIPERHGLDLDLAAGSARSFAENFRDGAQTPRVLGLDRLIGASLRLIGIVYGAMMPGRCSRGHLERSGTPAMAISPPSIRAVYAPAEAS
jgi:hypothetical protein